MHLQRAGTVKAGRTQTVKWAAEGARKGSSRVFCDVRHTSVAGNMLVFRREQGVSPEPRWHRGTVSVLDMYSCHGRIFLREEEKMTPNELKQYAKDYKIVPLSRRLYSDVCTPVEALRIVKNVSKHCYILESMEDAKRWGRYTFIGYDPKGEITCKDGIVHVIENGNVTIKGEEPTVVIRKILEANKSPRFENLPPFTGGLVGYFSYDYLQYVESSIHFTAEDDESIPDLDLMIFDKVIVFDNLKQEIILIVNIDLKNPEENYEKAQHELQVMHDLLLFGKKAAPDPLVLSKGFTPLCDKKEYCRMVEKGKDYIREGHIFQVVLSNRLEARGEGSLVDTYRILRTVNPSPYMFYMSIGNIEIAGASPETLVRLEEGKLFTYPLAGTCKRGDTEREDERLEAELLGNEKELAEHNMLVDLGRNDLGRISEFGSVQVDSYLNILRFSHVMHIGSTVCSNIRQDKTALDAIGAVLPAGTLSGAPKIRACEIIDELEKCKRGIYGGAVGYIDFTGNADTCISIRLAYKKDERIFVCSGAGIVADSIAEGEYEECKNKAAAVIQAVERSNGGID